MLMFWVSSSWWPPAALVFQNEIHGLIEKYSVNESLVEEIEKLKEENRRLKTNYWPSDPQPELWNCSALSSASQAAPPPTLRPSLGQVIFRLQTVMGRGSQPEARVFSQNTASVENSGFLLALLLPADWRGRTKSCFLSYITASPQSDCCGWAPSVPRGAEDACSITCEWSCVCSWRTNRWCFKMSSWVRQP